MAPVPIVQTTRTRKGPWHGVGIGADRVLPATAAPSSIQGEVRANNSLQVSAGLRASQPALSGVACVPPPRHLNSNVRAHRYVRTASVSDPI